MGEELLVHQIDLAINVIVMILLLINTIGQFLKRKDK